MLHLVDIKDDQAPRLVALVAAVADVAEGRPPWAHLEPHYNPTLEWSRLLGNLGLDAENRRSLERLVAFGAPGQVEGNRLVASWAKPASVNWLPYDNAPQVYQRAIKNAMASIAEGDRPWLYNAYYPSGANGYAGPAWAAMGEYEPSWMRPNAARIWEEQVEKDARGRPSGWKPMARGPAPWKPSWGMGGVRCRRWH